MLGLKSNYGDIICNLNKNSLRCFLFFAVCEKCFFPAVLGIKVNEECL